MKILVAVEDKTFGQAIADFVSSHDWANDVEFKILHVLEPMPVPAFHGYPSELMANINEERGRAAKSLTLHIGSIIQSKLPAAHIEEVIEQGSPKEQIVKLAEDWPADLIVVGSHGRTGLGRFLLGSVSLSVLSASPCSVVIVRQPKPDAEKTEQSKEGSLQKV
ncbi:MAG: universal stress protein [Candidatus Obscuribacterales bacterium]|jgi:nucleotide-binding universal stress UspA family protein|nr:universal stress protein [Candidatus Obscuribacterales bacterium]